MKTKQSPIKATDDNLEEAIVTQQVVKIQGLESSLARALADYANLERRFSEQSSSVIKFATSSLVTKLLDIRDNLALASAHVKDQSITMVLSSLDKLLTDEGVVEIKTDGLFDPHTMECQELGEGEKDKVVQVVRRGYSLHDRVLRTARVIVGSGVRATTSQEAQPKGDN